jgi:lipopolysaccharide/colanic/teichoic acid biosynthesis glycosyltransferase
MKINVAGRLAAAIGLIAISPVIGVCALAIYLEDRGPVFFRQTRIGAKGKPFFLLKLRSMRCRAAGRSITAGGDSRVTRVGKILRHFKIDELPQFWNVLRGDMNFIGPRPEVPEYVDITDPRWRAVLSVRPGITDPASLVFRHEEHLLAECGEGNVEAFYRERLLPRKLAISSQYALTRSALKDIRLIALTLKHLFSTAAMSEHELANHFLQ